MPSKANLSVCIIAKNEEKMLADCLVSVKDIANEIILVDTGSTDNTIEIAERFGCRVITSAWEHDFSKARNIALEAATYPFILCIDADERLQNAESVSDILKNSGSNIGGWLIEVISEAKRQDGSIDTYQSNLLRLFRNHPDIRFTGIIHEQIIESILKLGFKLENSPLKIIHLGYSHSPQQMHSKQLRNLELLNISLNTNPDDAYSFYQRAKTFLALGELLKAEEDISLALQYVNPNSAVKPQSLNFGAVIAYQMGNYDLAIERARESLKIIHEQSFANFILGESFTAKQNFEEALKAYQGIVHSLANPNVMASIVGDYHLPAEQLSFRLGRSYIGLQQFDKAKIEFEKGLDINPRETGCMVGLANIAFNDKNFELSRSLLEQALNLVPNKNEIQAFLSQVDSAIMAQANRKLIIKDEQDKMNVVKENHNDLSNGSKPLLSLCMIVRNEERMLAGCLDSVKGIADEIIIVDTGSEDSTLEIAQSFNAKIFNYKWTNDFAAARNIALKHCSGNWILYLDADERLKIGNQVNFREMLLNSPENIGGFICTIESNHIQLDGATEHHRGGYPRLFRNYGYPNINFQGRVHEQITPSIFALNKGIANSDIIIEHLGYNQSREVMEQKVRRNYALLMEHIKEEPLNAYVWYQLGQTLAQMSLFAEAEKSIRFSIELGKLSDSVYASATSTLAQLVGNQKKFEESLHWSERSLEKAPGQVYALNLKAYSLLYLDRLTEAEQAFLEVLRRLRLKKGVPQSGFDIDISEDVVLKGLEETRKKLVLK